MLVKYDLARHTDIICNYQFSPTLRNLDPIDTACRNNKYTAFSLWMVWIKQNEFLPEIVNRIFDISIFDSYTKIQRSSNKDSLIQVFRNVISWYHLKKWKSFQYIDLKSCLQCTALADLCKHTFCAVNFSFRCPGVSSLVAAGGAGKGCGGTQPG